MVSWNTLYAECYKTKIVAFLTSPICTFTNSTGHQSDKFELSSTLMNSKYTHMYTHTHTYLQTKSISKGRIEKINFKINILLNVELFIG